MTFVGKILVIVIMALALLFLGISTVVFTTNVNWKEETSKQKAKVSDLQKKNSDFATQVDAAKKDLEKSQVDHKAAIAQSDARIKSLEDEIKTSTNEVTAARSKLETANQSAGVALAEASQRRAETEQLRDQRSAVEKQANEYKLQHADLNDKIRELERQTKTLDTNNKELRERVFRFSTALKQAGLSDEVSHYKQIEHPPAVQGEISRVDPKNQRVEITIGSDDGLVVGHELYIYRVTPRAQYLGKLRILSVDPDQAVARVIGKVVSGIRLERGDIVSSTIRPRS